MGDTAMDGIRVAQCDAIVVSAQKNPHCCIGKSCSTAAAHLTIRDYATILSQRLASKAIQTLPGRAFKTVTI
ncbi:unnamed protein product [Caretta caretta]